MILREGGTIHSYCLLVATILVWHKYGSTNMVKPQPALTYENIQDDVHRIILPDGSSVCLQHGASLAFIEKDGMRLAELRGEAFFDVARDSIHPFIVNTEAMDIRVLGTAFSVSATPG